MRPSRLDWKRPQDGRSLIGALGAEPHPARAILIEAKRPPRAARGGAVAPSFVGVRTRRYAYIERYELRLATVEEGLDAQIGVGDVVDRELYDLKADPYQLESVHRKRAYAATEAGARRGAGAVACLRGRRVPGRLPVPAPRRQR